MWSWLLACCCIIVGCQTPSNQQLSLSNLNQMLLLLPCSTMLIPIRLHWNVFCVSPNPDLTQTTPYPTPKPPPPYTHTHLKREEDFNWSSFSAGCQFPPAQMKTINSFLTAKLKWKFPRKTEMKTVSRCHSTERQWEPASRLLQKNFPHLYSFGNLWICKCSHCGQELSTVDDLSMHKKTKHRSNRTKSLSWFQYCICYIKHQINIQYNEECAIRVVLNFHEVLKLCVL